MQLTGKARDFYMQESEKEWFHVNEADVQLFKSTVLTKMFQKSTPVCPDLSQRKDLNDDQFRSINQRPRQILNYSTFSGKIFTLGYANPLDLRT